MKASLISAAQAQPFGGPAGCCGGDSIFAPPADVIELAAWVLLIALMFAFARSLVKWLRRR
ncbi:hypothetical protein [Bradyrhizobium elkanii]|uniref:Uncharacterized protein n=1 Tax=Bradyrhizobium elkanii TaxID=29448 RepID=A0A8I2C7R3_BRAEL|nr:hypothetical protein [Bradyrhizobium elkanii]MBP1296632.1 hypothetical protein [Bradyrhizobium elkanii]